MLDKAIEHGKEHRKPYQGGSGWRYNSVSAVFQKETGTLLQTAGKRESVYLASVLADVIMAMAYTF